MVFVVAAFLPWVGAALLLSRSLAFATRQSLALTIVEPALNPDFSRLNTFFHVYKHGSIQKAAAAMSLTRSAVSQSLKRLEGDLNVSLFIRKNQTILPTANGKKLFAILLPFVESLEDTLQVFEKGRLEPRGKLTIGVGVMPFADYVLIDTIVEFNKKYSCVEFELEDHPIPILVEKVERNELDFAILPPDEGLENRSSSISYKPIWREDILLVGSPQVVARVKSSDLTYNSISQQRFISYGPNHIALKLWFKHNFSKIPNRLDAPLILATRAAVRRAALNGAGLAVLAEHNIRTDLDEGSLQVLAVRGRRFTDKLEIARLADKKPNFTERMFVKSLMENISSRNKLS